MATVSTEAAPHHSVDVGTAAPPSTLLALAEGWRAVLEASTLLSAIPLLNQLPKGDGHPVYVLPGFMADSQSTGMLQRWLERMGYIAIGWGFGRNLGPRGDLEQRMAATVAQIADHYEQPVSLIGQSLGGIFAREIAKAQPDAVRQVITLGSPFGQTRADGTYPAVRRLFELANGRSTEEVRAEWTGLADPPPVPSTSIFSKTDGIAHWKTCIERDAPTAENIEVVSSHCGMGFNPVIYYIIADRLAQAAGAWRRFEHTGLRRLFLPGSRVAAAPE
jgi:pimeloyl-ACP methyl ester carboxylesterase